MNNKELTVINLFGAPGTGKSTIAAALFAEMKFREMKVELVREYAKELVWQKRANTLGEQEHVLSEQHRRLRMLVGQVDVAITDCPLLLSAYYAPQPYYNHFTPFVLELFNSYSNLNIFLKRIKPYSQLGRIQSEKESIAIALELIKKLCEWNVTCYVMNADRAAPYEIIEHLDK